MRKFILISAALAALVLSACFSQPPLTKNYYSFMAALPAANTVHATKPYILALGTVSAAAGFEDRGLIYRIGPNQFEADFYNEFVSAPARLLADLAAQHLDNANSRLRAVKNPGLKMADFVLEIYLETLYGDFTGKQPASVADIRFTLNDMRRARATVVLDKTYHASRPIADKSPGALVAGLNACVNEILTELNQDIERAVR